MVMVQLILAGRTAGRSSSFIADNDAACEQTVEDGFQAAQLRLKIRLFLQKGHVNKGRQKWRIVLDPDLNQCFGSAFVSLLIRIRIQHFRPMRVRVQIQGFDDQKMEKICS
jgi:hypothetical protein